jgi:hypothetical protein
MEVPVHESRVTNVQNCVEPRACSEGVSVDYTEARRRVRIPDEPSRASRELTKPPQLPELCLGTFR